MKINYYKKNELNDCMQACKITSKVLDGVYDIIRPGISTKQIDDYCFTKIEELGAVPAPLFYRGFPNATCTSVNRVICHGIPDDNKILKEGDIINVDVTSIVNGWHGDSSRMYKVGNISTKAQNLLKVTYNSLMNSIKDIQVGDPISKIGKIIEKTVRQESSFSIVRDFCGHGLGRKFHENPSILHYYDSNYDKIIIEEGMLFTIEPMINAGKYHSKVRNDGWTAVTKDKSLSAQYEHTIYIENNFVNILTESENGVFYT